MTSIALYGCKSWTLLAETEQCIEAFEMKCYRRILNISYKDREPNDYKGQKIEELGGKHVRLLEVVKHRKLQWYGHITLHNSLAKQFFKEQMKETERGVNQGRKVFCLTSRHRLSN